MGKTVDFKELPQGKRRLFANREPIKVELPEEVRKEYGVVSVTIEPMTHRDASIRDQIKAKIEREKAIANRDAGIKPSEIAQYFEDHLVVAKMAEEVNSLLPELPDGDDESELENALAKLKAVKESKAYIAKKTAYESAEKEHLKKYDDLIVRMRTRDLTGVMNAELELEENAFETVYKYTKSVEIDGGTAESEISEKLIEPLFVGWILGQIESISYLTEGDIVAFR